MKKILSLIMILTALSACIPLSANAEISKKINANIKTKKVPAGTVLKLKLLNSVGSESASLGDQFDMMVIDNVKVNNDIVIPTGSVIRGSVEQVQPAKMLYKGGVIRLYFDHIVSSTGKQVPFYAGICNNKAVTYDGSLSSKTTYSTAFQKTADTTKSIVVNPTAWAWEKGESLGNVPKYIFAPLTAVAALPVAGIYFAGDTIADIFKKGEDISLRQGDILQVQLLKPIDMPVY